MDFKALSKNQQGALIAGAAAVVLSFFGSYATADLGPIGSYGTNAWDSWATLGSLLVLGATAIVALGAFAKDNLPDGVPWNLVTLGASGLGTLLLVLRAVTYGSGVSVGWSGILLWIAAGALTFFAFLLFKESGEKMPDMPKKDDTPPAA